MLAALALLLAGCAERHCRMRSADCCRSCSACHQHRDACDHSRAGPSRCSSGVAAGAARANLALGACREDALLSEQFRARALAPEAIIGYRVDDYRTSISIIYDDQSFYDRLGGGLYHTGISFSEETYLR